MKRWFAGIMLAAGVILCSGALAAAQPAPMPSPSPSVSPSPTPMGTMTP
jgi:hypothetical protein